MVAGRPRVRRIVATLVGVLTTLSLTAGVANAVLPAGGLTQLTGTAGCFTPNGASEEGAGTCTVVRGVSKGESAAVSPDGRNVYAGSYQILPLKSGIAIFSRSSLTGALTQLPGTAGCITPDGSSVAGPGTCATARGFTVYPGDGHDIVFSSDGRWAYIAAQNNAPNSALLIFHRNPATGALTQAAGTAGCITHDGSSQDGAGTCQTDATFNTVMGLSISSDGRFLYATDYGSPKRVHVLARTTSTGALSEIQCISEAPATAGCTTGRVVGNSEFLALSPDGMHAYGGDFQHGLSIFNRNPSTGLLTQKAGAAGCITDNGKDDAGAATCTVARVVQGTYPIMVSPNGTTLYDPAGEDRGFSVFHINGDGTLTQLSGTNGCVTSDGKDNNGASTCAVGRSVNAPYGAAISRDSRTLYVSDDSSPVGGVAIFSLNPTTGVATQLPGIEGCISTDGSANGAAGRCVNGRATTSGYGMTISPDGRSLYQATDASANAGLAVYAISTAPVCTATSVTTAFGKPITVPLHCTDADGDPVTRSILSGPAHGRLSATNNTTGTVTYTPTGAFSGTDTFSFAASDGLNVSAPATATIKVAAFTGVTLVSTKLKVDAHGNVTVKLHCPAMAKGRSCVVVANLSSSGGTPLGRARLTIAAGKTVSKHIHLNKAGRKLDKGKFKAKLRLTSHAGSSNRRTHSYHVTIKPAKKKK